MDPALSRLFKRNDSPYWWAAFRVNSQEHRESSGCRTKKAARAWATGREFELSDPVAAASAQATVRDALESLLEERANKGRSDATIAIYTGHAMRLCQRLGAVTLAALTATDVDAYVHSRRGDTHNGKPISQHTIAKEIGLLRMALRLALRMGCYGKMPEAILPTGFETSYHPVRRYLRWDDRGKFLHALSDHRRAQVCFILVTGTRFSECARAMPEDVDHERGIVTVCGTKTERSKREVPILSHVAGLFTREMVCEMPFVPWSTSNANRDLQIACRKAGIERLSPNDLRRTAAMWLRERGCTSTEIAEFLGHTTSNLVERVYGRLEGEKLGAALEKRLEV